MNLMWMKKVLGMVALGCVLLLSACSGGIDHLKDPFCELCARGTVDEVRDELVSGADVNARNGGARNVTALMAAAYSNSRPEVVKTLLASGADVNARDKNGWTALTWAIKRVRPNVKMIKTLLEGGADVNAKDNDGATPLMITMKIQGSLIQPVEVMKALLEGGADVNAKDNNGKTVLMEAAYWAAYWNNPEVIEILLEAGADINAKDKYGLTAEDWANSGAEKRREQQELQATLQEFTGQMNELNEQIRQQNQLRHQKKMMKYMQ